ncbi:hypothetical protein VNO78_12461 [Psophocarpus tetragonolobus]|uniref:Uncharacterized protein n=1 Tax=Psophocarpus tetragonolobus TaxID=3891 RepID=A0AAN9SNE0_PSOTE
MVDGRLENREQATKLGEDGRRKTTKVAQAITNNQATTAVAAWNLLKDHAVKESTSFDEIDAIDATPFNIALHYPFM